MTPTIGALPEDWDDPMTTPDTLAVALDALRWRDASETTPIAGARVVVAFADGEVNALHHGASVWPRIARWRPLPTPAGDAAIAAELERLRGENAKLVENFSEVGREMDRNSHKLDAIEQGVHGLLAERDALRAENAKLRYAGEAMFSATHRLGAPGGRLWLRDAAAQWLLTVTQLRTAPPAAPASGAAAAA